MALNQIYHIFIFIGRGTTARRGRIIALLPDFRGSAIITFTPASPERPKASVLNEVLPETQLLHHVLDSTSRMYQC